MGATGLKMFGDGGAKCLARLNQKERELLEQRLLVAEEEIKRLRGELDAKDAGYPVEA